MNKQTIAWQKWENGVLGLFLLAAYFFWFDGGIWLFLTLILVPDVFMLGYLRGNKLGAQIYNFGHSWILPVILLAASRLDDSELLLGIAIIWGIHICMDRALGYGLKLDSGFKHTHLGDISR